MDPIPPLSPGDCLLYGGSNIYDEAIKLKTFSNLGIVHVELFYKVIDGVPMTTASRNGQGVQIYPFTDKDLLMVRRPVAPVDLERGEPWLRAMIGMGYDWAECERFILMQPPGAGIVCSPFAGIRYPTIGVECFSEDFDKRYCSPRDFSITPALKTIWRA